MQFLMKEKKIAIIPARGGSKRIPKKNIKPFCGKPLIAYSIETALQSGLFDKVLVSTDSEEIAKVAKQYGANVQMRPKKLADDYTGSGEVVRYVADTLEKEGEIYDYLCTIYATAPFLQVEYLKKGYEALIDSDACTSFSVTSFPYPIQRAFKLKNGRCEMFDKSNFPKRSQDLEEAYHDAGQFYWEKRGCKSGDVFFGKDTIPIILPRHLVQDIDTPEDFQRAELMYKAIFPDRFDEWNSLKKELHVSQKDLFVREREVYFLHIGHNIGKEQNGRNSFLRPVLVYKKLSHNLFVGIPLTTKKRDGRYYFPFSYKKNKTSYALLNQIRTFDTKRISYFSGSIKRGDFKQIALQLQAVTHHTVGSALPDKSGGSQRLSPC